MALQAPYMPQPIDQLRMAFPAGVMADLMPAMDDIPEDFRRNRGEARRWVRFQQRWFYEGLRLRPGDLEPKSGIDRDMALRHLAAIQRSFEPKHEHKEAAVAYLASLWFVAPPLEES